MTRIIPNWKKETVDPDSVCPNRYTDDFEFPDDEPTAMTIREFREAAPYQPGDVIYVENGTNARISLARVVRVFSELDRYGFRCHMYKIQLPTKAGYWSKTYKYTWPGYIQRAYKEMEWKK